MDDITADQIYNLCDLSAQLYDIEDALWTSILLRDWDSALQWLTGLIHEMVRS